MEKLDELFKLKKSNQEIYKMSKLNTTKNSIESKVFSKIKSSKFNMPKIKMNVNQDAWTRVNQQKGLPMFGDKDKDGVPNILDCWPLDKKRQGFTHKKEIDGLEVYNKEEPKINNTKVEYIKGFKPQGALNIVKYYKQFPEELNKEVNKAWDENVKTAKEIFVGTDTNKPKKGLLQSGYEVLQDAGVLKSDLQKLKEQKEIERIQNMSPEEQQMYNYMRQNSKNISQYQSTKLKKGKYNRTSNLDNIQFMPQQRSKTDIITSNVRQGFSLTSGGTPQNLVMASHVPQRQPYSNVVYAATQTKQPSVRPTLMSKGQSARPSLISGMEIPTQVTLMPGRQIFPDTQAVQQMHQITQQQQIQEVQQPQVITTEQNIQEQQPQVTSDSKVVSPYSKKLVTYIRGKYTKHKPVPSQVVQQY